MRGHSIHNYRKCFCGAKDFDLYLAGKGGMTRSKLRKRFLRNDDHAHSELSLLCSYSIEQI